MNCYEDEPFPDFWECVLACEILNMSLKEVMKVPLKQVYAAADFAKLKEKREAEKFG